MAIWSEPTSPKSDGYATAAAAMVSLAIALVATAVTATSVAELRLARTDLRRMQAEYGLAGAETLAAMTVLESRQAGRLRWRFSTDLGPVEALAEPEAAKLGYGAAADLDDGSLARLGVGDPARVRAKLRGLALTKTAALTALRDADLSPRWRDCAASAISPVGQGSKLGVPAPAEPQGSGSAWHAGEVWRIRVSAAGWTEDRLVRFTGSEDHPAAIIDRRLVRGEETEKCETLIGDMR